MFLPEILSSMEPPRQGHAVHGHSKARLGRVVATHRRFHALVSTRRVPMPVFHTDNIAFAGPGRYLVLWELADVALDRNVTSMEPCHHCAGKVHSSLTTLELSVS